MNLGFYLYGILPAPISEKVVLEGLDQQPVQSYSVDGFNFLYSEAKKEKYLTSRRNLLCHEKVLELAMSEGFRTLLPLRFGLVVKTWETVTDQLTRPHKEKLEELFQQLEGRREVSVKVFWNSQSEIQGLLESNVSLKKKRDALEGKSLSQSEIIEIGKLIENGLQFRKQAVINF
ncbi:MAG: GvpL/GvpF family gas vesicle protein, partial [Nitrososphaera sp.]|nr:GvpL/GvpF family gas vesicle protein [Nitrososphaera sp.]